mgnify:CR=1 FL=1
MIVTAITGASGPIMGVRLVEELLGAEEQVAVVVSSAAREIIEYEVLEKQTSYTGMADLLARRNPGMDLCGLTEYADNDFFVPLASGSTGFEAVVVIPCSMKTLSSIVHGYADNLVGRSCDVALKEDRKCVIVPRETPMNRIQIENLYHASRAGLHILPPVPGFYTRPQSVEDVVDFIVGKTLSLLGKSHNLFAPWNPENVEEL